MDPITLTKKLISIPSYANEKTDEKEIGKFVFRYLKRFSFLTKIKKQKVEKGRFNVIANDRFEPHLLFICHLDTVEPRGWKKFNPLRPIIKRNRLYGLGGMDMKGGIASLLSALENFKKTKGLMLLFYCDEEYDFKGMKKFVKEYKNSSPRLAIASEPTGLKIWNGCRGLIKVSFSVKGKTAPASRPDWGKNAILGLVEAVKFLTKKLEKYKDKSLGISTCNLASIIGGLQLKNEVSRKGDAVADVAEGVCDIRSGSLSLKAENIKAILKGFLIKNSFSLENFKSVNNLGAFFTSPQRLKPIEGIIKKNLGKVEYLDLWQMGYQDIQLIEEKLKIPCLSFGPRGGNRHQPGEWVDIASLDKTKKIYQSLIRKYCSAL